MKNITILLLMIFSIIGCEKDNPSKPSELITEIDKLPPATQTGANKIGCLLDGKALLPGNYQNSTNCYYQYVNEGYYFHISFDNKNANNLLIGLALNTNRLSISEGQTLILKDNILGNASGFYFYPAHSTFTDQINTGELKITKLDPTNYIVSGTFWYNIIDYQGVKHEIREGRFDMHYTN